ncbi:MAG: lipid A deacylase LpxR family protein [Psychromonas sp.]|nr:lipid A deacylase LpxR family protein [Alteromonadales bacterium]MCP5077710.1 lipid A deacylase LpxR family protein [Psychromonas sp.]
MNEKLLITLFLFLSTFIQANEANDKRLFICLSFENDLFFKDDGLYSNVLFLTWSYDHVDNLTAQNLPTWLAYLAKLTQLNSSENKQINK